MLFSSCRRGRLLNSSILISMTTPQTLPQDDTVTRCMATSSLLNQVSAHWSMVVVVLITSRQNNHPHRSLLAIKEANLLDFGFESSPPLPPKSCAHEYLATDTLHVVPLCVRSNILCSTVCVFGKG